MPDFSHLHVHTQFSLLDGAADISKLYKKAAADGMKALTCFFNYNLNHISRISDIGAKNRTFFFYFNFFRSTNKRRISSELNATFIHIEVDINI